MTKFPLILLLVAATGLAIPGTGSHAARDTIVIGMQLEPPNLDPTGGAAAAIDEVVYANLFEGLIRYGPDGTIRPGLAQSWTISDDGLTYTFALRRNVLFHDGSAFDAGDVKFSLDRARADDSSNAQKALFAGIAAVNVIDPATVEIVLSAPNGTFTTNLAWGDAIILDPASAADAATNPIGTGPFRFSRWVKGDRVELVRNPDYWGEPVALSMATFKFISDPTAAFGAMMAGDLDAFPNYPSPETLAQFDADPRFSVIIGSTEGETILSTNNMSGALQDIRVRQAIAHAIDRQAIIDGAMFGYGTPIGTHFAPHNPDYLNLTDISAHDPDRARALLAEAGHAEGLMLRLMLPPPSYARRGGEIVAAQLRDVGIDVETSNLEWAQWLEQVFRNKDYDLTIVSHTEPGDINIYARPEYYFQYDSTEFQALNATLAVTADPAKRRDLLHQAQRLIADDFVNGYLFQLAKLGVADARIRGIWANAPTQANDLTGVSWVD